MTVQDSLDIFCITRRVVPGLRGFAEKVGAMALLPTIAAEKSERESSLVALALTNVRAAIVKGELLPGQRLGAEALATKYGISSSPLREALTRLIAEGFVEARDRRGFRVKPVTIEELKDVTRVRVLLEREALSESMSRGDDEWEARVIAAYHRLDAIESRLSEANPILSDEWSERHREFHQSLISACTSPNLLELCDRYYRRAERYRRLSARYRPASRRKSSEHRAIMELALARSDEAASIITAHISRTADNVAALFTAVDDALSNSNAFAIDGTNGKEREQHDRQQSP